MPNRNDPAREGEAVECFRAGGRDGHNIAAGGREAPAFPDHRAAALALLNHGGRLTRKAGSFLGQLAVDPTSMTPAQADWIATLLDRAGLPPLADGGRA